MNYLNNRIHKGEKPWRTQEWQLACSLIQVIKPHHVVIFENNTVIETANKSLLPASWVFTMNWILRKLTLLPLSYKLSDKIDNLQLPTSMYFPYISHLIFLFMVQLHHTILFIFSLRWPTSFTFTPIAEEFCFSYKDFIFVHCLSALNLHLLL